MRARGEENERGRVTQPQFGEDRAAAPQQDEQRRCAMRGERAFERNHVNSPVERIETFHAARRRAIRDTRARTACVTRADGKRNTGWSAGARRRWRRRVADERRCDRWRGRGRMRARLRPRVELRPGFCRCGRERMHRVEMRSNANERQRYREAAIRRNGVGEHPHTRAPAVRDPTTIAIAAHAAAQPSQARRASHGSPAQHA